MSTCASAVTNGDSLPEDCLRELCQTSCPNATSAFMKAIPQHNFHFSSAMVTWGPSEDDALAHLSSVDTHDQALKRRRTLKDVEAGCAVQSRTVTELDNTQVLAMRAAVP